ncbi:uncharacterized protein LOC121835794 [Ixodes scapularis]|uniref:uncharacterized protein LOC121835794 n=1 Tax=Ixodes scapularis TaxID=6945 RepID=UPI001C388E7D|nr:uncharacterized protein LOC121835794 [Ixodes scapularis]
MREKGIYVDIDVDSVTLRFLVDTGSSVSLLSEDIFHKHFAGRSLTDATVTLLDYSKKRIPVKGCFLTDVAYKHTRTCVLFHVVQRGKSLLGLDAIQNLQLNIHGDTLSCLQTVAHSAELLPVNLRGEFSHLFSGELGLAKGFVHQVKFLNQRGIKHCVSSVYYPQANGLVERFNRSLKDFIQVAVLEGRPLKEAVVDYLGVYRSTPHSTTGVSPAQLLHGRQPRTRLDIMGLPSKNFFQEPATAMEQLRARVQSKQRSTKEYTDAKRSAKTPKFKEGDFVRVRKPTKGGKDELSYSRPLKIQKQVGSCTFRLEDGRSWNASKLVAVPEECVTERSKRLLHLLPVPGDQEQSARRTVSDNQGEYSVGENREALATPCPSFWRRRLG